LAGFSYINVATKRKLGASRDLLQKYHQKLVRIFFSSFWHSMCN